MGEQKQDVSLSEAALSFLASLPVEERKASQQDITRFVSWYGKERAISRLTAPQVAEYAERMALSDAETGERLAPVRAFLTYAKEEGLVQISLAPHLRVRRGLSKAKRTLKQSSRERVELTPQAEAQLKSELSALKEKRPYIAEELRKAAADKDFRENAPLDAARESKEQLEARIKELESTLNSAVVAKKGIEDVRKARLSSKIVLQDLASNKELSYTLVSPNEVDPLKGKISLHSPMGKALFNHQEGEVIEVVAPLGKLYYRIERIES